MSVSPLDVQVSAFTGQTAPTADVEVSATGPAGAKIYVGTSYSTQGIANVSEVGGAGVDATIQFKAPSGLGAGTFQDTIKFIGCYDQGCSQQVTDSPQTVQVTYTVTNSIVQIVSLSPNTAIASSQNFTLTLMGKNFTPQSQVVWNGGAGNAVSTFFVSDTQLTAHVATNNIATPGSVPVSVTDPVTGVSNTVTFTVTGSPIQLGSLSPSSAVASGPNFLLSVYGTQFTRQSMVLWAGVAKPTTFISSTRLVTQVTAAEVAAAGNVAVSVTDPTNGSPINSLTFTIQPATLTLESVSPGSVTVGGPSFMLSVFGAAFTGTSTVQWNGSARPTTFVSSNELIAQIGAADIATLASALVTVQDPNSTVGTTAPQTVAIVPASKDAVAFQINAAHSGAVNFASVTLPTNPAWSVDVGGPPGYSLIVNGKIYVVAALPDGDSNVLALDQATGATVWGPVTVSGPATATYDSGRIFVAASSPAGYPFIEALDSASGLELWSTTLIGAPGGYAAATAADGLVFFGNGALDQETGAPVWQLGFTGATDAVTADGVYIAYACYTLALRPATGEMIWNNPCAAKGNGGATGAAVVASQQAYAQTDWPSLTSGSIFNAETGASAGTYTAHVPPAFSPTVGYFLDGGTWQLGSTDGATLSGVKLSDNSVLWTFMGDGKLATSPIVINQYVFIGSAAGNVYALDGTTGQQVWQTSLGAAIPPGAVFGGWGPPSGLSAGDGLLVIPNGTKVTAYVVSTNP